MAECKLQKLLGETVVWSDADFAGCKWAGICTSGEVCFWGHVESRATATQCISSYSSCWVRREIGRA